MDRAPGRALRGYLVATAFLSGFSVMVLEMAAVRAVAPYFGASNYTWTNVIGVILGSLAAGYFVGGRFADRFPRPALLFQILLVGGILCLVLPVAVRPISRWLLPVEVAMEGAAEPVYRASLVATLLLFAPPVFVLGAVSPFAIKLLAAPGRVGGASGWIFAASTAGSLLGTFLTTFALVPLLGTRLTLGLAGGTLVGTGLVGLAICGLTRWRMGSAGVGAGAAMLLLLLAAGAGAIKEDPGLRAEVESAYQYLRVVDRPQPDGGLVTLLQINEAEEAYQSVAVAGSVLTGGRYYDYYSTLPMLLDGPRIDALVIGLAAGTIPRQLRYFHPEGLTVTGVEIDPAVLDLGRRYFGMVTGDWLRAVVADGRVFLETAPSEPTWDLVIVDAFAQEYYIPFHLATRETFEAIRTRLREGGIVAMNVAAYRPDSALLEAVEATVADVFGRVYRVPVDNYPNYMLFAMKGREPDLTRLVLPGKAGTPDLAAYGRICRAVAQFVIPSRIAANATILTDDLAPVERLTDVDVARESRAILGRGR